MTTAITTSDLRAIEAAIEVVVMTQGQSHQNLIPEDVIDLTPERVKATGLRDHDHHLLKQGPNKSLHHHHQGTIEIQGLKPRPSDDLIVVEEREVGQDPLSVVEHHHLDIVDPLLLAIDS